MRDITGGRKEKSGFMVVLKKLKAASLVETLTATVIIVVVFIIASMSFNNVFLNTIKSDDTLLQNRLEEITYFIQHDKLGLPFYEEGPYWVISGEKRGDEVIFDIENIRQAKSYQLTILRN